MTELSGMCNVSCSRVFIGQREITPLAIYYYMCMTVCAWLCVLHACVFVCASVGGMGSTHYSEREKEMEGKRAFGAPCPVLAWFLCIPCRN